MTATTRGGKPWKKPKQVHVRHARSVVAFQSSRTIVLQKVLFSVQEIYRARASGQWSLFKITGLSSCKKCRSRCRRSIAFFVEKVVGGAALQQIYKISGFFMSFMKAPFEKREREAVQK